MNRSANEAESGIKVYIFNIFFSNQRNYIVNRITMTKESSKLLYVTYGTTGRLLRPY